jgi:hypothetical protein
MISRIKLAMAVIRASNSKVAINTTSSLLNPHLLSVAEIYAVRGCIDREGRNKAENYKIYKIKKLSKTNSVNNLHFEYIQ